MVLELPNKKQLFGQRDVRETTTSPKEETLFWSCAGALFHRITETLDYSRSVAGKITADSNVTTYFAQVTLPHGAVITGAIVNGEPSTETWTLKRVRLTTGAANTLATANLNTEEVSISLATIDNNTYAYFIITSSIDIGDIIFGARITYTIGL